MSTTLPTLEPQIGMLQGHRWRTHSFSQPARNRVWPLVILCIVALSASGYLAYASITASGVAGCGAGDVWDCSHVLNSRWSRFFNWPISVIATGLYSVLIGCLMWIQMSGGDKRRRIAWSVIMVGAVCAGLAAIWFISLQAFAVGRLCGYCMLAHACGIALCLAVLWRRPLGTRHTAILSSLSVLAVSVLIGGQLMATPPESFKIDRFADEATTGGDANRAQDSAVHDPKRDVEVFEPF